MKNEDKLPKSKFAVLSGYFIIYVFPFLIVFGLFIGIIYQIRRIKDINGSIKDATAKRNEAKGNFESEDYMAESNKAFAEKGLYLLFGNDLDKMKQYWSYNCFITINGVEIPYSEITKKDNFKEADPFACTLSLTEKSAISIKIVEKFTFKENGLADFPMSILVFGRSSGEEGDTLINEFKVKNALLKDENGNDLSIDKVDDILGQTNKYSYKPQADSKGGILEYNFTLNKGDSVRFSVSTLLCQRFDGSQNNVSSLTFKVK